MTSLTLTISVAGSSNERSVFAQISAEVASSVPVARARFKTDGIASSISFGAKPALPSSSMADATWEAVNEVVRPRNFAFSVRSSNSLPVAPVTALTARIWSSKSEKTFIDAANGAPAAMPSIVRRRPMALMFSPNLTIRASARLNVRISIESSAKSSTKARPALIADGPAIVFLLLLFDRCQRDFSFHCATKLISHEFDVFVRYQDRIFETFLFGQGRVEIVCRECPTLRTFVTIRHERHHRRRETPRKTVAPFGHPDQLAQRQFSWVDGDAPGNSPNVTPDVRSRTRRSLRPRVVRLPLVAYSSRLLIAFLMTSSTSIPSILVVAATIPLSIIFICFRTAVARS